MRYVSIDIETTGLDPERHQIIEFAAVIEDTENMLIPDPLPVDELPTFHRYLRHENYVVDPWCVCSHRKIWEILKEGKDEKIIVPHQLGNDFHSFLIANGFESKAMKFVGPDNVGMDYGVKITVAGKNFNAFDYQFLKRLNNWNKYIHHHYRVIDPTLFYWNPFDDYVLPDMKTCIERSKITTSFIQHNAVDDARFVIELIRSYYDRGRMEKKV